LSATRLWKIAAAAAGLTLAGAATAAAVGAPDASLDGRSTGSDHAGFTVPVGPEDHAQNDDQVAPTTEDETAPDADEAPDAGGPQDNHGAEVSAVAKDDSTQGREHGEAVSEVARGDHGADADHGESAEDHGAPEDPGSQGSDNVDAGAANSGS
jgi:hypothetical protein